MTFQYALRFESGKRRGEVVSISAVLARGGVFTIGRKPGNSLQVVDASVSGRHAEFEVTADGVDLRDLGSTNGTLLGGRKVRAATLVHLDEFTLGAIQFTLLDQAQGGVASEAAGGGAAGGGAADGGAAGGDVELELDLDPQPAPTLAAKRSSGRVAKGGAAAVQPGLSDTSITPREDSLEITAEDLVRSRRSSKLGPILLVGLAALGAGAWWWLGQRDAASGGSGGRSRASAAAVEAPAGNLLGGGYSFEQPTGWVNGGSETDAEFDVAAGAARSGRRGLRAELGPGEVATLESTKVKAAANGRALRAVGFFAAERGSDARLGLRFSSPDGSVATTVWSSPAGSGPAQSGDAAAGVEFVELSVVGYAPPGMENVHVLVRAASTAPEPVGDASGGAEIEPVLVDVDDVALVTVDGTGDAAPGSGPMSDGDLVISPMGGDGAMGDGASEPTAIAVTLLDSVLISSLRVAIEDGGLGSAPLALAQDGSRVTIRAGDAGTLVLRAEARLVQGGIGTLASAAGYASHGTTFERAEATDLLLGSGFSLLRLQLSGVGQLSGRPQQDAVLVRADVRAGDTLTLQTRFDEERTRADRLARRAVNERKSGDSGAALRTWNELLAEVPFDQRLIEQASIAQSEILGAGRGELKALASEVERARFFGLADLYREKLARATELAERFRGSDLEIASVALADSIRVELRELDSRFEADEARRLEAIHRVLEEQGAETLSREVEAYRTASGSSPRAGASPAGGTPAGSTIDGSGTLDGGGQ